MVDYLVGIDEAGRGPLIGPLVIVACAVELTRESGLKELGVKDSKLLSEKQREDILKELIHRVKYELTIIPPSEIDEAVNSKNTNLNWLEADHGSALLNKLDAKLDNDVSRAIIDCPSTNIQSYKDYFREHLDNTDIELLVEHKADFNHLIVGAASIIAKVTREKELEHIKKKLKIDFGSGYPGDPKTKQFVEKYWDDPKFSSLFRKSWATYKAFADKGKQSRLDGFE